MLFLFQKNTENNKNSVTFVISNMSLLGGGIHLFGDKKKRLDLFNL